MENLTRYLLSISAAAIICALIRRMLTGKGAAATLGKILSGVFFLFTILSPLTEITWEHLMDWTVDYQVDAATAVQQGQTLAKNELDSIISERVRAYILDKASTYDAALSVSVTLSQDAIPVPVAVTINGHISPYGKRQLQTMIVDDLGIPKEAQTWT